MRPVRVLLHTHSISGAGNRACLGHDASRAPPPAARHTTSEWCSIHILTVLLVPPVEESSSDESCQDDQNANYNACNRASTQTGLVIRRKRLRGRCDGLINDLAIASHRLDACDNRRDIGAAASSRFFGRRRLLMR